MRIHPQREDLDQRDGPAFTTALMLCVLFGIIGCVTFLSWLQIPGDEFGFETVLLGGTAGSALGAVVACPTIHLKLGMRWSDSLGLSVVGAFASVVATPLAWLLLRPFLGGVLKAIR